MFIPDESVREIKEKALIQDVVAHYVTLKKKGKELEGECPFCNHKKFSVSPAKQIYKCWNPECEKGGNNAITFIMEKENQDYPEALRWLADFYNIFIPDPSPSLSSRTGRQKKQTPSPTKVETTKKDADSYKPVKQPAEMASQHSDEINQAPLRVGPTARPSEFLKSTMRSIGLSPETNRVQVKWMDRPSQSDTIPLISQNAEGNLEFSVYDIEGFVITHEKQTKDGSRILPYKVIRLKEPVVNTADGKVKKYHMPKGVGTRPFFPPSLLDKFAGATPIDTLFLTEGYKKAISGWVRGLDIIGLTSISTYRNKETLQLHHDIVALIKRCLVRNVVLLYDGDCADISPKAFEENKDISLRPRNFFASATGIKELLKDHLKEHEISLYFAQVNSDAVEGHPKGLDDLYEAKAKSEYNLQLQLFPGEQSWMWKGRQLIKAKALAGDILNTDLLSFSEKHTYFTKINITFGVRKLEQHLALENATFFYLRHQDIIKDRRFVYFDSQFHYNTESGECEIVSPAASKNYNRVGDEYFETVPVPNKNGTPEMQLFRRSKSTIVDDHGKAFLSHIQKYKAFCNVPDHTNYQQVISNCYNTYHRFEWEAEAGDCFMTLDFLRHIFEEQFELGLDYLQLLYQRPTQILPILCLVSKENNTGKTTFAKWLKHLFKSNMAIVGNADLANDFNGFWSTKLIICCDEAFIEKKVIVERIKSLSTTDRITLNQKGRDQLEIDFFGKFLMLSNNEDNFIYATDEDIRYWIRKIKRPAKEIVNLDRALIQEIPAFLHLLANRTMHTQAESRMWFRASLLETQALENVRQNSRSSLEKQLRMKLQGMFEDFSENIVYMTLGDIKKEFFHPGIKDDQLQKIIEERLGAQKYYKPDPADPEKRNYKTRRYHYPKWHIDYNGSMAATRRIDVSGNGRPYVFLRPDFVSPAKEAELTHDPEFVILAAEVPDHFKRPGMLDTGVDSALRKHLPDDTPL